MTTVTTARIWDERIDVSVTSAGFFEAEWDDVRYSAKTLDELQEQLTRAVKKTRETKAVDVSVLNLIPKTKKGQFYESRDPFEEGRGVVHAKLRGKHERESAWLLTSDDGKRFKISNYSSGTNDLCRRLTSAEVEEYMRLAQAVDAAEAALDAFRKSVHVHPEDVLKKGKS